MDQALNFSALQLRERPIEAVDTWLDNRPSSRGMPWTRGLHIYDNRAEGPAAALGGIGNDHASLQFPPKCCKLQQAPLLQRAWQQGRRMAFRPQNPPRVIACLLCIRAMSFTSPQSRYQAICQATGVTHPASHDIPAPLNLAGTCSCGGSARSGPNLNSHWQSNLVERKLMGQGMDGPSCVGTTIVCKRGFTGDAMRHLRTDVKLRALGFVKADPTGQCITPPGGSSPD
jgi:hypothetical protein